MECNSIDNISNEQSDEDNIDVQEHSEVKDAGLFHCIESIENPRISSERNLHSDKLSEKLNSSKEKDIESCSPQEVVLSEATFTIQNEYSDLKEFHAKIIKSRGDRTHDLLVYEITSPIKHFRKRRPPLHYRKEGYKLKQLKRKENCLFFLAISVNKHDSYLVCCDGEQFTEILLPPHMNGSKPIPFTKIHKIMNNKIQLKNWKNEMLEINMETCSENIFDLDTADEGMHINFYQNKQREQVNEQFKIILRNNTS